MFHAYGLFRSLNNLGFPKKQGWGFFKTSYYSSLVLNMVAPNVVKLGLSLSDKNSMKIVTEIMTEVMDIDVSTLEEGEELDLFLDSMDKYVEVFLENRHDPIFIGLEHFEEGDDRWNDGFLEMQSM